MIRVLISAVLFSLAFGVPFDVDEFHVIEKICHLSRDKLLNAQTKASAFISISLNLNSTISEFNGKEQIKKKLEDAWKYAALKFRRLHTKLSNDGKVGEIFAYKLNDLPIDFKFYETPDQWNDLEKQYALERELNTFADNLGWRVVAFGKAESVFPEDASDPGMINDNDSSEDSFQNAEASPSKLDIDMIFVIDHALVDGFSIKPIMEAVVKRFDQNIFKKTEYELDSETEVFSLPPRNILDSPSKAPFRFGYGYLVAFWELLQAVVGPLGQRWVGDDGKAFENGIEEVSYKTTSYNTRRLKNVHSGLLLSTFDKKFVDLLKEKGRPHKSTITSTFAIAALVAYRKLSEDKGYQKSNCHGLTISMNLRMLSDPPIKEDEVGNYFNGKTYPNFCFSHSDTFWAKARSLKASYDRAFATRREGLSFLNSISDFLAKNLLKMGVTGRRPNSVVVSSVNLDPSDLKFSEVTQLRDVFGTSSSHFKGCRMLFTTTIVSTKERTRVAIGYPNILVEDSDASDFKSYVELVLGLISKSDDDMTIGDLLAMLRSSVTNAQ